MGDLRRNPGRAALRVFLAATTLALLTAGVFVAPLAATDEIATSIEITAIEADTPAAFIPTTFRMYAHTSAVTEPAPCGTVRILETTTGSPVEIGTIDYPCNYGLIFTYTHQAGFGLGTHTFKAVWEITPDIWADSESPPVEHTVTKVDSFVALSALSDTTVETHNPITFEAPIGAYTNAFYQDATVTFWRSDSATPVCTMAAAPTNQHHCTMTFSTPGSYSITAVYTGNTWVNGSTSPVVNVTALADTVHASAVGLQYTTFYPYRDGYKDTVAIKGTRNEPIAVTIKVYSPSGTLRKSVSIGVGTGAYSYAWNGRNSAGTWYAEGKYKVVQTLKDAAGTTKVVTSYVTLSKKRIYTYTKTVSRLGSSLSAWGRTSGASVTVNRTSGWAKLYVSTPWYDEAAAGWELTLPSATIYKSFYVRIYGRHYGPMVGNTQIGAQNFSTCAYVAGGTWYESCGSGWKQIASTSGTTLYYYRSSGLSSSYRSGTKVRVMVTSTYGTTLVYKAQVVVTYGILKY